MSPFRTVRRSSTKPRATSVACGRERIYSAQFTETSSKQIKIAVDTQVHKSFQMSFFKKVMLSVANLIISVVWICAVVWNTWAECCLHALGTVMGTSPTQNTGWMNGWLHTIYNRTFLPIDILARTVKVSSNKSWCYMRLFTIFIPK